MSWVAGIEPDARLQWMRQPRVQMFGAQEEIYKLTHAVYNKIEPLIKKFSVYVTRESVDKYDSYVSLQKAFEHKDPDLIRVMSIEGPEALIPRPAVAYFALPVDEFGAEAEQWGSFNDEEVYGWKCSGEELNLWFNLQVGDIKRFGIHKERAIAVPYQDGFAIELYLGTRKVGWLGRRASIATRPPWAFVSMRMAERIATGCLYDVARRTT